LTLSSPATRRDRLAAWRAGAWACLGDPLDAEELLAVLEAFLPAKLDADQARTDGLIDDVTGVYNVRGVTRRARELAAQATRHNAALGCVLLAPDFSETITGEPEEEELLQDIAIALKSTARMSDAIGRLGPSAFIILAVNTNAAQAHRLGERLADAILAAQSGDGKTVAQPLRLYGGCHGVSDFRTASIDASELMLRATAALDRARSEPNGSWLRDFEEQS
jgi:diguanylate cyclase (GGDEF)-like protein